jgi:hypothetical protein
MQQQADTNGFCNYVPLTNLQNGMHCRQKSTSAGACTHHNAQPSSAVLAHILPSMKYTTKVSSTALHLTARQSYTQLINPVGNAATLQAA